MKNRELIATLNGLYDLRKREEKREKEEKVFTGRVLFLMSRNLRTLEKEYNENYLKDLQELRSKYYISKEKEVVIPEDAVKGIKEHKETKKVEVLKPDCTENQFQEELGVLLDIEVKPNISKVAPEDLANVYDFKDMDAIQFMVE